MNQIEKIVEAVFEHGKRTPNLSGNLPKGQMTIVEAISKLEKLCLKARKK